jgi:hypothetical protein
MSGELTLFVCHIDDGGPPPHACKRAQRALRAASHDFDKVIAGRGIPFGLFMTGRRPELTIVALAVARELTGFCWALANAA